MGYRRIALLMMVSLWGIGSNLNTAWAQTADGEASPADTLFVVMCNTGSNPKNNDGPIPGREGWFRSSCYINGIFVGAIEYSVDPPGTPDRTARANFITLVGRVETETTDFEDVPMADGSHLMVAVDIHDSGISHATGFFKGVNRVIARLVMEFEFDENGQPHPKCRFGFNAFLRE